MHYSRKRLLSVLALAAWLAGCQESLDCPSAESVAGLSVRFVRWELSASPTPGQVDSTKVDAVLAFRSISANGLPVPLYENDTASAVVKLPLDPTVNFTVFVFRRAATVDTIQVSYRRKFGLAAAKCTPRVDFSEIVLTSVSFPSFGVVRKTTDTNENDVEVYLRR
ncbi:MAG: hypothetical protein H7Z75_15735 [Ferruginibacter sp.]|nr:hypothetical protein [Cytophagales bacterium]